jgi:hypothetical protein
MTSSLNLLREYLKLVFEGKVEDLAKQNPNVDVKSLSDADSTPTKKLLQWMVKQVSKGADVEHVKSVASRFAKDGNRLSNKDINSYSEIDELETALDALGASKRSETVQAKSGAVKIYEDSECTVLRIDTKEAAQQYGKCTKWCITMQNKRYYEEYVSENVLFYYILRKELFSDDLDKVALVMLRDENNTVKQIQVFDQTDREISSTYLVDVSAQALTAIKSDAKSQPKAFLARIKSGDEYSDNELIAYWRNLGTEQDKITFLSLMKYTKRNKLQKLLQIESDEEMKEILSDLISGAAITGSRHISWRNSVGRLHRNDDKPAVIYASGGRDWYQNGKLHRDGDKPAIITSGGARWWYQNGKIHRDGDKPAFISANGTQQEWYNNGVLYKKN